MNSLGNEGDLRLRRCIRCAIAESMIYSKQQCCKKSPQEPDYVAGLTINFTSSLYKILKCFYPKHLFSVTGVFCHQKPFVNVNIKGKLKNSELGDLLLVYVDHDNTQSEKMINSLLLQAKISSCVYHKVSSQEQHQLTLYRYWPKFRYVRRAGAKNQQIRDVQPKKPHTGAQYLLINTHQQVVQKQCKGTIYYPEFMKCALPNDILYADKGFSAELIDFLRFRTGRIISEYSSNIADEWSKVIWDLLQISKNVFSKRTRMNLSSFPRVNSEKDKQCPSIFDEFTEENNVEANVDNENEISLILIEHKSGDNITG
ncbi:MAG: hypothetical protein IJ859_05575 [Synergistaceae bacterium]|nr:hypothetical protein [Synergistaceae bacterium]